MNLEKIIVFEDGLCFSILESSKLRAKNERTEGQMWDVEFHTDLSHYKECAYDIVKQFNPNISVVKNTDKKYDNVKKLYRDKIEKLLESLKTENTTLPFSKHYYFISTNEEANIETLNPNQEENGNHKESEN